MEPNVLCTEVKVECCEKWRGLISEVKTFL